MGETGDFLEKDDVLKENILRIESLDNSLRFFMWLKEKIRILKLVFKRDTTTLIELIF